MKIIQIGLAAVGASSAVAFAPISKHESNSYTKTAIRMDTEEGESKSEELWGKPTLKEGEKNQEMSIALPFAVRPKLLDGSLPGDVGFDPLGFAGEDKNSLLFMREAEVKHSRLAMLAVVGWPLAELYDKKIAAFAGFPDLLTKTGESPSLLNGGLEKINPAYWVLIIGVSGLIEEAADERKKSEGKNYIMGDCGFDPLRFFPVERREKFKMQEKEIKHGRIAMMAILGFVIQEALYRVPVVAETPFFFQPIF
uniref:Uncharacterized protein n=1 Tax=Corethron hystrix TaxID=216773 RepID=A0A7S1B9H5_9STRA|mmetsp:Transcript_18218/g.41516  ORF Transcript_18218/g.41516 Transcript_18218/m.41516 type:complete len:253 (+) Transcript_18218:217-975(+)